MEDKMIVCFYYCKDCEEPKRICSFYTRTGSEYLKLYDYAKKNNVELYPHDLCTFPDGVEEDLEMGVWIEDVSINFGDNECIQGIDVYLK